MGSWHWSARCWASLVRTVLLIQWVSYSREFQAVEMCHFPLPGVGDGLDRDTLPILIITI